MDALLVLQDGTIFEGESFGASGHGIGEVVFNTSMSGYQEILTDPSYAGQIVTLTQPHIGNYGVCTADMESSQIHATGLVVREISELASNFRSEISLADWLAEQGVPGISGIDTRSLTRRIRDSGVTMGIVVPGADRSKAQQWLDTLKSAPDYGAIDFVPTVSVSSPTAAGIQGTAHGYKVVDTHTGDGPHCVVVDFGVKHSILKQLCLAGFRVTRVPHDATPQDIAVLAPDAVLLSNGPGDPARMDAVLPTIRDLAQSYPTWGICLGHQLISRAWGASTFKLPFGHRGPNQPVQDLRTRKVEMTSQNHGYAVDATSMPECLRTTHVNLNDHTIEGVQHAELNVHAVQYHPEAGPGPHDASAFFTEFYETAQAKL